MEKEKRTAVLLFLAAVLCYLSAAINFFVSDRSMGATLLCLGSSWLCLGSVEYNKLKKSAPEADAEDEGAQSDE